MLIICLSNIHIVLGHTVLTSSELDSILARFNLSKDILEKSCCDNLFIALKTEIESFEDAAPHFGFKQPEIEKLCQDFNKERTRKLQMLWTWRKKNGSDATYISIVKIFLEMKKPQLAEFVLKFCSENKVPLIDSHVNPSKVKKYRNWSSMTKFEQEKVTNALRVENQEIRNKYSSLTDNILTSLEERKIEVDRLKLCVATSLREMSAALLSKFEHVSTLAGVLLIVHLYYSSWFNIHLFKHIVEKLGSDDDKSQIKSYEEDHLVPYLQRSIFEIPSNSFGPSNGTLDIISLGLHLPGEVIPTGNDVAVIKHNLSKLLGITDENLVFIRYDEGSTILIFGLPETLFHTVVLQNIIEHYFTPDISKGIYSFSGNLAQIL